MADLYLTPAEKYTAALGGFYYGDLPEPGTVYTQLIKDILDGSTPDKEPKNILARFIYSLYISDLGDPYPRYELAKLLYWKLHNITPTKSGSVLTVTIDGKEDYMTINTDLSRLWYKVLFGSKTDIITEFPYIFNTMQNKLSDWELFGNTEASGTPTPDSPVMPQGTGERTGNLFDELYSNISGTLQYRPIYVGSGNFTLSTTIPYDLGVANVFLLSGDVTSGASTPRNGAWLNHNVTAQSVDGYVTIAYRYYTGTTSPVDCQTMLNSGSTALPYEPYGYKIPISSVGQTAPVYLGEVESTRRIKKLVLTGEETFGYANSCFTYTFGGKPTSVQPIKVVIFSNAYEGVEPKYRDQLRNYQCCITRNYNQIAIRDDNYTDATDFKVYLQQQYAAGTPVTIWYVLATEETGIVNESLMKIGDYADSISRAQTGIDIPTVIGQNTLDVLTTVKPSSMSIEYTSADENRSRSKRISLLKSPLKKRLIK